MGLDGGAWFDPDPGYLGLGDSEPVRRSAYKRFLREVVPAGEWALIRESLQCGQLTGNQRFVDEVARIAGRRVEFRRPGRPSLSQSRTSGSVGAAGGQSPVATQPPFPGPSPFLIPVNLSPCPPVRPRKARPLSHLAALGYNCGRRSDRRGAMSVSVRIDDALVDQARAAAKAEFRTVQGQIEFWAKVGRAALDNPDLPASFIAESLMAMAEPREETTAFVPRTRG